MTSARSAAALALVSLLSACSGPEDRVARTAKYMDQAKGPTIDSVRAEGNRLIIRHKNIKTGGLNDSEMTRFMSAGLCRIEEIRELIRDGGTIRIELPRNFDYFAIDIDRCDA